MRGLGKSLVVACERHDLSPAAEKLNRRKVQGVQRANRRGEGLQGARQNGRSELHQSKASNESSRGLPVGRTEFPRVNSRPNLVLEQTTGNQRLLPELRGRYLVFC